MGKLIIDIAFAAAAVSAGTYLYSYFRGDKYLRLARLAFHISAIFTIISSVYLMYLIITHQFQYTYVWSYSSRNLPLNLLVSTFYAGQEGSFHLWAFFMAVIGIFLLAFTWKKDEVNKDRFELPVMGIFMLIQTFLLFVMILKSPYTFVWESFSSDVQMGYIPEDGRGLNPLLQNFWMTIHPPILFLGFAVLAVPYCFAIAALMRNEYNRWLKLSMPWTLFGAMTLGAGIMIGGYWAYGVLGWGGYWGWDPVENASLVPWILTAAAIHTMVSQERTGRFKKTSLLLCITAFVMVLYSTFLTRSGILGDSSVHSFIDPGQMVYLFLIVFLALFGAGGIGLVLFRLKSLKTGFESANFLSREAALLIGAITLCASALVIAVGTSFPIFAKGTVEPDFYNRMNLPIGILVAFINAISILLKWKHSDEKDFVKSLWLPLSLTGIVTIFLVIVGLRDVLLAVFAAGSLFAFFVNAEIAYRFLVKNKFKAGPYIAHLGIMILFLGIIASGKYSQEVNVSLPLNETKDALGYKLTYKGATPIPGDEEKYYFNVVAEQNGKAFLLQPVMYYSEYSEGVMKNPDIANLVTKDFYLSPMGLESAQQQFSEKDMISLNKGEEIEFKGMKIKFIDFDRSKFDMSKRSGDPDPTGENMHEGHDNTLGAELEVTLDGKTEKLIVEQNITQEGTEYIPVRLSSTDRYVFYLVNVSVQESSGVGIAVTEGELNPNSNTETLVLTASVKPFINLVWAGTIVMIVGFFMAMLMRVQNTKPVKSPKIHTNGEPARRAKKKEHAAAGL
jgi:cytochrome c-type biogenesis protein CcmF